MNTQNKDYYTSTHKDVCRTIRRIIAVKEYKIICCILVPTNCYQMDPKMWAVSVTLGQGTRPVAHPENNCSEERKWQGSQTTPGAHVCAIECAMHMCGWGVIVFVLVNALYMCVCNTKHMSVCVWVHTHLWNCLYCLEQTLRNSGGRWGFTLQM